MKSRLAFAALLLATTTPLHGSAQEQPWVEDPDIGEGTGIAMGDFELHPSFAAEFGYDSNYLRRGPRDLGVDGQPLPIIGSLRLRLTPSLRIATATAHSRSDSAPAPVARFRLNTVASAGYSIFIPLEDTDEFEDRGRLGGGVGAGFELFPVGKVTWDVHGAYSHTVDPSSVAGGELDFDRHSLNAGTGVTWRPGGGLFEWRLGYDWRGTYFTEDDYDTLDNGQHTVGTKGRWRFLPRTALLFDSRYRFVHYFDESSEQVQVGGETIQSQVGLAGLFTNRFAFRVMGGWAASFFDAQPGLRNNFDGPVGNAEIKWFMTPSRGDVPDSATFHLSSVAVGYSHDYGHSYLGPFYASDRGYLAFKYFIGNAVATSLQGYVAYNTYPDFIYVANGPPQTDVSETRVGGTLFAEYRVTSNVGINATLAYDRNISDDAFRLAPNDMPDPNDPNAQPNLSQDGLEYQRFQAFAGIRMFW